MMQRCSKKKLNLNSNRIRIIAIIRDINTWNEHRHGPSVLRSIATLRQCHITIRWCLTTTKAKEKCSSDYCRATKELGTPASAGIRAGRQTPGSTSVRLWAGGKQFQNKHLFIFISWQLQERRAKNNEVFPFFSSSMPSSVAPVYRKIHHLIFLDSIPGRLELGVPFQICVHSLLTSCSSSHCSATQHRRFAQFQRRYCPGGVQRDAEMPRHGKSNATGQMETGR